MPYYVKIADPDPEGGRGICFDNFCIEINWLCKDHERLEAEPARQIKVKSLEGFYHNLQNIVIMKVIWGSIDE
jgi:hypothetical protein